MKIQEYLNARNPNLSKIGHRASGIGHRASGIGDKSALLAALATAGTLLSFAPLEQSQAQLILTLNPLQGDTNNITIWTFSGSSSASRSGSITTTQSSAREEIFGSILSYNALLNQNGSPSPGTLFTSSTAYTTSFNHSLSANSASRPQVATPSGTRTISHIYLEQDSDTDLMGIRVGGSALSYSTNDVVSWSGQGTLSQSITNFVVNTAGEYYYNFSGPYFAAESIVGTPSSSGLRVVVSSAPKALVPEPEEYALVFALFALGFVFFHRRMQRKRRQQASTL